MDIPSISEMDVKGKRLVVRADLNVPMKDGKVSDATRITRFAEGMKPLLAKGARLVILTHFGRPKGKVVPELSVAPVQPVLSDALGMDVPFCATSSGPEAEAMAAALKDGEAMLCENVRFDPREEANDSGLAALFARLGDIYVNDAFSCAHRAHVSTEAIAHLMPSAAGFAVTCSIASSSRLPRFTCPRSRTSGRVRRRRSSSVSSRERTRLWASRRMRASVEVGSLRAPTTSRAPPMPASGFFTSWATTDTISSSASAADSSGGEIATSQL